MWGRHCCLLRAHPRPRLQLGAAAGPSKTGILTRIMPTEACAKHRHDLKIGGKEYS
jgi:hypothetical protein